MGANCFFFASSCRAFFRELLVGAAFSLKGFRIGAGGGVSVPVCMEPSRLSVGLRSALSEEVKQQKETIFLTNQVVVLLSSVSKKIVPEVNAPIDR